MKEDIKKYQVATIVRDAEWQVRNMKQTHFSKAEVLEMFEDIINEVCKEKDI